MSTTTPLGSSREFDGLQWVKNRFEVYRPEYATAASWVTLAPGARVLDVGCGFGGFLGYWAQKVGPKGQVVGIDRDEAVLEEVRRAVERGELPPQVSALRSEGAELPYPDRSVDAVVFFNAFQNMDDAEAGALARRLARVIRPGGTLWVKDVDLATFTYHPVGQERMLRLLQRVSATPAALCPGFFRGRVLKRWLEGLGFSNVGQRQLPIERWAPLDPLTAEVVQRGLVLMADLADRVELPEGDRAFWRAQRDPAHPEHLLRAKDFYRSEVQILAWAQIP